MRAPKIVVVGAGSASFGPAVIQGLLGFDGLDGVRIHLHDVDPAALAPVLAYAARLAEGTGRRVEGGTDRAAALDGADAVILSVAVDREETWRRDRALGRAHGIEHYAENGGPGALFHTGRNLSLLLPILRDMEVRCPGAWLVNYTNPLPRICEAVRSLSAIPCVGVCHQLGFGYSMARVLLARELGVPGAPGYRFVWTDEGLAAQHALEVEGEALLRIRAAGLNHFTWALEVTERATGRDLYPALREALTHGDPGFEPLTRAVAGIFGLFPVPGDCHLCEYLPYTHSPARGTWARYDVQMYDLGWGAARRRQQRAQLAPPVRLPSERAEAIVAALLGRTDPYEDEALDLPNAGQVEGLEPGTIVETPATVSRGRIDAAPCGALPLAVTELLRRQAVITRLTVEGFAAGDRDRLRQALALDPMVDDPAVPDALLDAFFRDYEDYL
jgi:alpha-galactosidase